MCTPVDLEALAVGFLFNEGLIDHFDEIASVRVCERQDNVDVWLTHAVARPTQWQRTSGCAGGVTGAQNHINAQTSPTGLIQDSVRFTPPQITILMSSLLASQNLYQESGGVHSSALSDGEKLVLIAEDIGRHNTLDKIAGRYLLERIRVEPRLLFTTGRVSSEMLQKTVRLGAAAIISRTAPTSLSVRLAETAGITLIGYARRDRFNVYTHPERIEEFE